MKPAGAWLLLLLAGMPFVVSGQVQSGAPAPESSATKLPLVITDKAAVEEWSRAMYGESTPSQPNETDFLLSLSDTEWLGRFRFRQRCAVCHALQTNMSGVEGGAANPLGPVLTKRTVAGREEAVRRRIMDGSARMPAFKYALEPNTADAIIAYLKRVDRNP